MENEIRCNQCGAKCDADNSYCPKCHSSISAKDIKNEQILEDIPIETWKEFIGNRANDYIEIFKKHENKKFFISFNPFAFFLGISWMYYRKMFVHAIITSVVSLLLVLFVILMTSISSPLMLLTFPVEILFCFSVGAFSNCAYKNHVKKTILEHGNNPRKCGTSYAVAIIGTIATWLVTTFIVEPMLVMVLLNI